MCMLGGMCVCWVGRVYVGWDGVCMHMCAIVGTLYYSPLCVLTLSSSVFSPSPFSFIVNAAVVLHLLLVVLSIVNAAVVLHLVLVVLSMYVASIFCHCECSCCLTSLVSCPFHVCCFNFLPL